MSKLIFPAEELSGIVEPLLSWYDRCRRVLPWRENPTPYRVWVSEIMLQQTRVEAVKGYYERFLSELPDIRALAAAPEEKLLKLWEGLGYYSRARNLQKAAKLVAAQYDGKLPASYDELLKLPGFGAYTAGAVASIAFGIPVPAVDGNVLRVISRILASREDIAKPEVKAAVTETIQAILPVDRVGDFNQSLMELGATVCLPNGQPMCESCPVASMCEAYRQGATGEIPVKAAKKARRIEERTVFLLVNKGRVALRKRPDTGLLAGLWEFPSVEGALSADQTVNVLADWGLSTVKCNTLKAAKHIFTHIEWRMTGYLIQVDEVNDFQGFVWADRTCLTEELTLPSAFQAYYKELLRIL